MRALSFLFKFILIFASLAYLQYRGLSFYDSFVILGVLLISTYAINELDNNIKRRVSKYKYEIFVSGKTYDVGQSGHIIDSYQPPCVGNFICMPGLVDEFGFNHFKITYIEKVKKNYYKVIVQ